MKSSNIILIGTGAISNLVYLPLVAANSTWRHLLRCVDRNAELLNSATKQFGVAAAGDDYRPLLSDAAVAIIATPPRSHFPIARECLNAGLHVILEKPLTETYAEASELVRLAQQKKKLLMVNNTRRLFQSYKAIKEIINSGELGALIDIDYAEGGPFAWPTASGFYFDIKEGRRGVISDRGSHMLDILCWWAGERLVLRECRTDADGGMEGFCDVHLGLPRGKARMRLSWHNKLANRVVLRFEQGLITTGIYDFRNLTISRNQMIEKRSFAGNERSFEDYALTFARTALEAVYCERSEPPIQGSDVLPSIQLIDECYQNMERLEMPWLFKRSLQRPI